MNRRRFLTLFAAAAGAAVVAPAIPAARVWSFPSLLEKLFRWRRTDAGMIVPEVAEMPLWPVPGNNFLTISWITYESLMHLEKNLRSEAFEELRDLPLMAVGSKIPIKMPQAFAIGDRISIVKLPIYSGAPPGRPPVNQLKSPRFPFRPAFGIPES